MAKIFGEMVYLHFSVETWRTTISTTGSISVPSSTSVTILSPSHPLPGPMLPTDMGCSLWGLSSLSGRRAPSYVTGENRIIVYQVKFQFFSFLSSLSPFLHLPLSSLPVCCRVSSR